MIDVVYQYLEGPSKWEELRYSLRSIDKHLLGDYRVWFVGDKPNFVTNVHHIPVERLSDNHFPVCLDATRKMNATITHPEISDRFMYMYDDIYFLQDTHPDDIKAYHLKRFRTLKDARKDRRKHVRLKISTVDALLASGACTEDDYKDFESHLPRVYDKDRMLEIFETYKPIKNRLLHAYLYFNHFRDHEYHELEKGDGVKAEFFGNGEELLFTGSRSETRAQIDPVLDANRFMNHNNDGLTPALQNAIAERFPDKCRFEL